MRQEIYKQVAISLGLVAAWSTGMGFAIDSFLGAAMLVGDLVILRWWISLTRSED